MTICIQIFLFLNLHRFFYSIFSFTSYHWTCQTQTKYTLKFLSSPAEWLKFSLFGLFSISDLLTLCSRLIYQASIEGFYIYACVWERERRERGVWMSWYKEAKVCWGMFKWPSKTKHNPSVLSLPNFLIRTFGAHRGAPCAIWNSSLRHASPDLAGKTASRRTYAMHAPRGLEQIIQILGPYTVIWVTDPLWDTEIYDWSSSNTLLSFSFIGTYYVSGSSTPS